VIDAFLDVNIILGCLPSKFIIGPGVGEGDGDALADIELEGDHELLGLRDIELEGETELDGD